MPVCCASLCNVDPLAQIAQEHITAESPAPMLSPRALSPVKMRYCAWERSQELSSAENCTCERPGRPVAFCLGWLHHSVFTITVITIPCSAKARTPKQTGNWKSPVSKTTRPIWHDRHSSKLSSVLSTAEEKVSQKTICKRIQCTVLAGALCCNDFSCYLRYLEIAPSGSKDFVHIQLEASWCFYWVSL